jgi:hypothetical protein
MSALAQDYVGIVELRKRLRARGIKMSHPAIHVAIATKQLPAYVDELHHNKNGEPVFLFKFEEVLAWHATRVVRYVAPKMPVVPLARRA